MKAAAAKIGLGIVKASLKKKKQEDDDVFESDHESLDDASSDEEVEEDKVSDDEQDKDDSDAEEESEEDEDAQDEQITPITSQSVDAELLHRIAKDLASSTDTQSFKSAVDMTDWSTYTNNSDLSTTALKSELQRIHKAVMRKLTLREVLTIALSDAKKYLPKQKKDKKVVKSSGYHIFLKEFHAKHQHMTVTERMKLAGTRYKELSEAQKEKLSQQAKEFNIKSGFLNEDGTTKKVAKKANVTDLRPLFTSATPSSPIEPLKSILKEPKQIPPSAIVASAKETVIAPKSPKKGKAIVDEAHTVPSLPETVVQDKTPTTPKPKPQKNDKNAEDDDTMPVSVIDYFTAERKAKGPKANKPEIHAIYHKLPLKDWAQFAYRIMQSVESKYKKRAVLSKSDQELLDKHEGRPVRPGTAYTVFQNEKNADPELAHLPYRQKSSVIGAQWKQLDAATKATYEKVYLQKKAAYELSYHEYLANLPQFRREQELSAVKVRRVRKRRASLSEVPETTRKDDDDDADEEETVDERTNSTFLNESSKKALHLIEPAKRRVRSKTIDCSTMNIRDFFQRDQGIEVATPVLKGTPVKKKKTAAVVEHEEEVINEREVTPEKTIEIVTTPLIGSKKKSPVKKAEEDAVTVPLVNGSTQDDDQEEEKVTKVVSPKKAKKEVKKKPEVKKVQPEVAVVAQVNGKKEVGPKVTPGKNKIAPEGNDDKKTKNKKEPKEKVSKTKKLTEPVKPPVSAKEYFKAQYQGDPSRAGKEFKKLPREEKERYHNLLQEISKQYLEDLTAYMRSLSKEEVALYMAKQQSD